MTKEDLVKSVKEAAKLSEAQAKAAVNGVFEAITLALINRDEVKVHKFGTFKAVHKPPREARNPQTGAKIMTADKHVPKFDVSESLAAKIK